MGWGSVARDNVQVEGVLHVKEVKIYFLASKRVSKHGFTLQLLFYCAY